ncbi:hypothetical protein Mgra_00004470, partial [Meloidogyne graminicola]
FFRFVLSFLLILFYSAETFGIRCYAGQKGSNFRVGVREYDCPAKFNFCYTALCNYDDWLYTGYFRMGCADKNFCEWPGNYTWRRRCSELKGVGIFNNNYFMGVNCRLCNKDLCNEA